MKKLLIIILLIIIWWITINYMNKEKNTCELIEKMMWNYEYTSNERVNLNNIHEELKCIMYK